MAHYRATVDIQQARPDVFAYLSDFSTTRPAVENLGVAGTDTVAVVIVERSGRILALETGDFEEQKAERLAASLASTPSLGVAAT